MDNWIPYLIKHFCVWAANYFLPHASYAFSTYSVVIITLALLFITYFLLNGILLLPWQIVVQPKLDQPDHLLWPCLYVFASMHTLYIDALLRLYCIVLFCALRCFNLYQLVDKKVITQHLVQNRIFKLGDTITWWVLALLRTRTSQDSDLILACWQLGM